MSSLNDLCRQLGLIFTEASEAISLVELLALADDLASSTPVDDQTFCSQLEQELSAIHSEFLDHSVLYHAQVLLAVLYHLRERLTPHTIITFWFDIVLRPALREPKLATASVGHAKELVLCAMNDREEENGRYREKIGEFRTRLFDLYLLDALNEGSEEDLLEWAELDGAQREKKTCWKDNLEDILFRFGEMCPDALIATLNFHFLVPSSRLQLLLFLNKYISSPTLQPSRPLVSTLLQSTLYDDSATALSVALTILVRLLPIMAVYDSAELKRIVSQLFVVFVRALCWPGNRESMRGNFVEAEEFIEESSNKTWSLRPEILESWQRLDPTFGNSSPSFSSSAVPAGRLFTYLYYLFPCNLLRFLRDPIQYLTEPEADFECPYIGGWTEVLDVAEIRTKSEVRVYTSHIQHVRFVFRYVARCVSPPTHNDDCVSLQHLIRGHICHPLLIWQDAGDELSTSESQGSGVFWKDYDIARISSEAMSLDLRYMSIALRERHRKQEKIPSIPEDTPEPETASGANVGEEPSRMEKVAEENRRRQSAIPHISLQQMITASVLLKSHLDIQMEADIEPWAKGRIFESPSFGVSSAVPLSAGGTRNATPTLTATSSTGPSPADVNESESVFEPDSLDSPTSSSQSPTPTHNQSHSRSSHAPGLVSYSQSTSQHNISLSRSTISTLQREILLLRTELNFEMWLSRENMKHIGRLYQDRVVNRNAERERQGLYNKLRTYRSQVVRLESELREAKALATTARQKHVDWSSELQGKLRDLREEKKGWVEVEARLRRGKREVEAQLQTQSQLLSSASAEVFKLQTFIKEHQHKIDRLKDYEAQIEQGRKMQRLWDADFEKFQRRGKEIDTMKASWKQMEMRLESLDKGLGAMEEQAKHYRRQIQILESQLSRANAQFQSPNSPSSPSRQSSSLALITLTTEKVSLLKSKRELEEKNTELREELEELEVMCEELRGKVNALSNGQRGIVYDNEERRPSLSPVT
ncbi:hypothetical protein GYMLUDRAFT_659968 [Collybiopsis luxurians FD-317 M1]|uniref:Hamartin n=1 Tax=Collybiopsis luxurians FD-317 M1 TaxID=944289 RepID=A0A0D0B8C8_9AGAR|nr:hypothetical protein GYMLUDRAFT_659968 [Collybiopsis luxurians FD-317 M1]